MWEWLAVSLGLINEEQYAGAQAEAEASRQRDRAASDRYWDSVDARTREAFQREAAEWEAAARASTCWACGETGGDNCYWCEITPLDEMLES